MYNATVCVSGCSDSTVYAVQSTDTNGDAHFSIHPFITGDQIYVTVTRRNLKPYEGSMLTVQTGTAEFTGNVDVTVMSLEVFPNPGTDRILIQCNPGTISNRPPRTELRLQIYDKTGRLVRRLVEKSIENNGRHNMIWHADDDDGRALPAGVYYIILQVGDSVVTEEVTLLD